MKQKEPLHVQVRGKCENRKYVYKELNTMIHFRKTLVLATATKVDCITGMF